MKKIKTFRKIFALGLTAFFLATMVILPDALAQTIESQRIEEIREKIIADAPKLEDLFPEIKLAPSNTDKFDEIDQIIDSFDVPDLTL